MQAPDRTTLGAWGGAALVVVGAVLALVSLTVDGSGMPRGSGTAWASATLVSRRDAGTRDDDRLVVSISARGDVAASSTADSALRDTYEHGSAFTNGQDLAGERAALARSVPSSLRTLAIYLAIGVLLGAIALAAARRQLRPLWPLIGAAALALLVVAVLLRQQTVAAVGSWVASMNLAELHVHATAASGRPVAGAVLALAGALVGALTTAPAADPTRAA
jgi:hypothetical protein